MYIRELKGVPQVIDLDTSTLRLMPFEVKEILAKDVNKEVNKRVDKGYVLLIEDPAPKKTTAKEVTN